MANSNRTSGLFIFLLIVFGCIFLILPLFRFGIIQFLGVGLHAGRLPLFAFLPMALLFLFWLLVSVWVYNDAERSGMSGLLWALLVFFGNIVGLLIYLIVRSSSASVAPLTAKTCPSCHGVIQPDFNVCPHCGANLQSTCPSCKSKVQSTWNVCPYCGESLKTANG